MQSEGLKRSPGNWVGTLSKPGAILQLFGAGAARFASAKSLLPVSALSEFFCPVKKPGISN